ncbi:hypothetical protein M885DRAFT_481588, partial [Pelagophyceae sp. CCMP2097]
VPVARTPCSGPHVQDPGKKTPRLGLRNNVPATRSLQQSPRGKAPCDKAPVTKVPVVRSLCSGPHDKVPATRSLRQGPRDKI